MGALLLTSSLLLSACIIVRMVEEERGMRFAPRLRHTLDVYTVHTGRRLHDAYTRFIRHAKSDILLKGLHAATYLALVVVRAVEKRLLMAISHIRSFRKDHPRTTPTHKLAQLEDDQSKA